MLIDATQRFEALGSFSLFRFGEPCGERLLPIVHLYTGLELLMSFSFCSVTVRDLLNERTAWIASLPSGPPLFVPLVKALLSTSLSLVH